LAYGEKGQDHSRHRSYCRSTCRDRARCALDFHTSDLARSIFYRLGKEQRGTESFIKRLPFGIEIRKFLDAFDSVLTPRDRDYEQHVKTIVTGYDPEAQAALRKLYRTRNTNQIADHYRGRFVADGFIEYPKDGPGWIKPELRDVVARTLDDLAA
jgi:hypothetical protein